MVVFHLFKEAVRNRKDGFYSLGSIETALPDGNAVTDYLMELQMSLLTVLSRNGSSERETRIGTLLTVKKHR